MEIIITFHEASHLYIKLASHDKESNKTSWKPLPPLTHSLRPPPPSNESPSPPPPPHNLAPPETRAPEPSWLLLSRKNIITQNDPGGKKRGEGYENPSLRLGNLVIITRLLDCYWFFGPKLWWGNHLNGNISSDLAHWSLVIDRAKSGHFCLIWMRDHWRATWIISEKYSASTSPAWLSWPSYP